MMRAHKTVMRSHQIIALSALLSGLLSGVAFADDELAEHGVPRLLSTRETPPAPRVQAAPRPPAPSRFVLADNARRADAGDPSAEGLLAFVDETLQSELSQVHAPRAAVKLAPAPSTPHRLVKK